MTGLLGGAARGVETSLEGIIRDTGTEIRKQSLCERFNAESVLFMQQAFSLILQKQYWDNSRAYSDVLGQFKRVYVVDSTSWNLKSELSGIFPASGGKGSSAGCKTQLCYELKSGGLADHEMTPFNVSDQDYGQSFTDLAQTGDLILFDLGYSKQEVLEEIDDEDIYFITRLKSDSVITSADGKQQRLVDILKKARRKRQTDIEFETYISTTPMRVVATRLSAQQQASRLRKLKKARATKGRAISKADKELSTWGVHITNIPAELLPAHSINETYRLRWSIELLFKQLKSTLNLEQANHCNQHRLKCEVIAKLIIASIACSLHAQIQSLLYSQSSIELSINKTFKLFQQNSQNLITALQQSSAISFKQFFEILSSQIHRWARKEFSSSKPTTLQRIKNSLQIKKNFEFCA